MRIALDLRSAFKGMGGIGRYAWCLATELAAIDPRNEYVCYRTHLEPPEEVEFPGRFTFRSFEAGMIDERFDQFVLPGLLREDGIDLYHNPTFAVPLIRGEARTVATIHDVVFRRHPELVEPKLRKYLDRATQVACKAADRLITVSHFSKKELLDLYSVPAERVTVIHNGVLPPGSREPDLKALSEQGLEAGGYILYVGSIESKKNIHVLLQALALLVAAKTAGRPSKLVLAGSKGAGDYPLEMRVRDLGLTESVLSLGYVSSKFLETLYAGAGVFVYPSLYEGFGFPPLEAMARGIPTLVSDASSLPEVVGDAAVKVDPARPGEWANSIRDLLENPGRRAELSEQGRRRAGRFTWRSCAERHLELFQSTVKSREDSPSCV